MKISTHSKVSLLKWMEWVSNISQYLNQHLMKLPAELKKELRAIFFVNFYNKRGIKGCATKDTLWPANYLNRQNLLKMIMILHAKNTLDSTVRADILKDRLKMLHQFLAEPNTAYNWVPELWKRSNNCKVWAFLVWNVSRLIKWAVSL